MGATYNPYIAAFVTSQARLHLLSFMRQVEAGDGVVCYFDTDSLVYFARDKIIQDGEYLGCMKNELAHSEHITRFIAGGPKNYGYSVLDTNTGKMRHVHRAKGIPAFTRDTCNFSMLDSIVEARRVTGEALTKTISYPEFRRSSAHDIYTTTGSKAYRITASKGCYIGGGDLEKEVNIYPYGYRMEFPTFDAEASLRSLHLIAEDKIDILPFWATQWFM
ncbi:MAG: hypothetical protein GY696_34765 [Gammaproteobacteria bacterium]|nr:hypothetical protein [Gammaproteobacteria bacterium]